MTKAILTLLLTSISLYCFADPDEIVLNCPGQQHDHAGLPIVPADIPYVYYDDVAQTIIIDGDGVVDYYDVEIASVTNFVTVISTQANGYYDTIDISSLPQGEYVITIYSPEGNIYDGFFDTY